MLTSLIKIEPLQVIIPVAFANWKVRTAKVL